MNKTTTPITLKGIRLFGTNEKQGIICHNQLFALAAIKEEKPFIYMREMTEPSDLAIMEKAEAVITSQGGPSCHAAIVCGMKGIDCLLDFSHHTYDYVFYVDDTSYIKLTTARNGIFTSTQYCEAVLDGDTLTIEVNI